jgi:hypothetical protein
MGISQAMTMAPAASRQLHPPQGLPADCQYWHNLTAFISRRLAYMVNYIQVAGPEEFEVLRATGKSTEDALEER